MSYHIFILTYFKINLIVKQTFLKGYRYPSKLKHTREFTYCLKEVCDSPLWKTMSVVNIVFSIIVQWLLAQCLQVCVVEIEIVFCFLRPSYFVIFNYFYFNHFLLGESDTELKKKMIETKFWIREKKRFVWLKKNWNSAQN